MRKYLVNATYCIYLTGIRQFYSDESIMTIKEVVDEIKHELSIKPDVIVVTKKKTKIHGKLDPLSSTDSAMVQTAKAMECVLVTDDQKLIKVACQNKVHAIDTPHFIHLLVIEGKWPEEKALGTLEQLRGVYNREHIISKVIKDIHEWR